MTSTIAQCRDPGVRNEMTNTTLAAFPSEEEREGLGYLKGAWEYQHNAWAYFLDGQNKKQKQKVKKKKKKFKENNDSRNNISTINKRLPSCSCRLEVRQILIHNKQAI